MKTISEPARDLPVIGEHDICVVGGSPTGVFAAVRAARLGADVGIVEGFNGFGGTATVSLVCVWHSLFNTEFDTQIIAGLTEEVSERLIKRDAVELNQNNPNSAIRFNPNEMMIELDEVVTENNITPYLLTQFSMPYVEDGELKGIIVENKSGRGVILASQFVDATGDGDVAARLGLPFTISDTLQPPTTCGLIQNLHKEGADLKKLIAEHREEFSMAPDSGWNCRIPDNQDAVMCAETHVFNTNAVDHQSLTKAEIEGRRQLRAIMDILRKYSPRDNLSLMSLPGRIGIRETRLFENEYRLTEDDVLYGKEFEDTIAYGSYRVDVHNTSGGGWVFKYLDGTYHRVDADGTEDGRWREETDKDPTYYQIPFRTMVNRKADNLIMAGRMICVDKNAFGATRVMVNCNQTGEAAGVAAYMALDSGTAVHELDTRKLRESMKAGGSVIL